MYHCSYRLFSPTVRQQIIRSLFYFSQVSTAYMLMLMAMCVIGQEKIRATLNCLYNRYYNGAVIIAIFVCIIIKCLISTAYTSCAVWYLRWLFLVKCESSQKLPKVLWANRMSAKWDTVGVLESEGGGCCWVLCMSISRSCFCDCQEYFGGRIVSERNFC